MALTRRPPAMTVIVDGAGERRTLRSTLFFSRSGDSPLLSVVRIMGRSMIGLRKSAVQICGGFGGDYMRLVVVLSALYVERPDQERR